MQQILPLNSNREWILIEGQKKQKLRSSNSAAHS